MRPDLNRSSISFLTLTLTLCLPACGILDKGEDTIVGSWTCTGNNAHSSEGSTWNPSEDEISVEEEGGAYVLRGWSECQPEVDLPAEGDENGIEVSDTSCDTSLGHVEIRYLILSMDGEGATFEGDIHSVVTEPVQISEDFDWDPMPCDRL